MITDSFKIGDIEYTVTENGISRVFTKDEMGDETRAELRQRASEHRNRAREHTRIAQWMEAWADR